MGLSSEIVIVVLSLEMVVSVGTGEAEPSDAPDVVA